jgi:hypothetical protein
MGKEVRGCTTGRTAVVVVGNLWSLQTPHQLMLLGTRPALRAVSTSFGPRACPVVTSAASWHTPAARQGRGALREKARAFTSSRGSQHPSGRERITCAMGNALSLRHCWQGAVRDRWR